MPNERATIYAVAQRAGVSISTVSLAINHPLRVSDATRTRVLDAVRTLGYRTAPADVTPTRGPTTRTVAVAAPFSSWPSYYERLGGVLERMTPAGVSVQVVDLRASNETPNPVIDSLPLRVGIDGVIVMGAPLSGNAEASLLASGTPAVVVDAPSERFPTVSIDDVRAGATLGAYLVQRGVRRLLFAHEPQVSPHFASAGVQRLQGIKAALSPLGGRVTPVLFDGPKLLEAVRRNDAVACSNDLTASAVIARLRDAGLRIPEDVAVTGFDDGPVAEALQLTTVGQPLVDSGRAAADLLIGQVAGTAPAVRSIELETTLIERRSTSRLGAGHHAVLLPDVSSAIVQRTAAS